jgi:hypothetical protein
VCPSRAMCPAIVSPTCDPADARAHKAGTALACFWRQRVAGRCRCRGGAWWRRERHGQLAGLSAVTPASALATLQAIPYRDRPGCRQPAGHRGSVVFLGPWRCWRCQLPAWTACGGVSALGAAGAGPGAITRPPNCLVVFLAVSAAAPAAAELGIRTARATVIFSAKLPTASPPGGVSSMTARPVPEQNWYEHVGSAQSRASSTPRPRATHPHQARRPGCARGARLPPSGGRAPWPAATASRARLSDGEYVMDAETVALLGDGPSAAGAKKLGSVFRVNLRKAEGPQLGRRAKF